MYRGALVVTMSLATAHADSGTDWLVEGARRAATEGDCAKAKALGERVRKRDEQAYVTRVAVDPTILACQSSQPRGATTPVPLAPTPPPPSISLGRIVAQSTLGVIGAFIGILPGLGLGWDCYYGCEAALTISGVGLAVGASVGVAVGGIGDGFTASAPAMLGASAALGVIGIYAFDQADDPEAWAPLVLLLPTLGAMVGYYGSRTPLPPPPWQAVAPPTTIATGTNATLVPVAAFDF